MKYPQSGSVDAVVNLALPGGGEGGMGQSGGLSPHSKNPELLVVYGQRVVQSLWSRNRKILEITCSSSDSGWREVSSNRQVTIFSGCSLTSTLFLSPGKKSGDRLVGTGSLCPVCIKPAVPCSRTAV